MISGRFSFIMTVLAFLATAVSFAQTTVSVAPETTGISPGESATLAIGVTNVTNLHGVHIVLAFDNSTVVIDSVSEGPFLRSAGPPVFFSYNPQPGPTVDSITIDQAILDLVGVSGSGGLFNVSFHGVSEGTSPVTLSSVELRDPMNHTILSTTVSGMILVWGSVDVAISSGWNMISNPVTSLNDSVTSLFPTSLLSYAYAFNPSAGYVSSFVLTNGVGYWGRFPGPAAQTIRGMRRTADSIRVISGWNMVGTISNPVDTSAVVSNPPGLRLSSWFGFGQSGYNAVTQLLPGRAYWVRCSSAGTFVLTSPPVRPASRPRR